MTLNFKMSELLHSDIANMYGINNNTSNPIYLDNMLNLIYYVLQPLRDIVGCPVIVTGGFRSHALWQKLKDLGKNPSKTSQHLTPRFPAEINRKATLCQQNIYTSKAQESTISRT